MSFLITTAAIGVGSLAYGVGKGISQNHKASQIEKNNLRPTYQIPQEYIDNVNMARQMSQVGLPQQQYDNQVNNIYRNQSSGLNTLSRSANPGAGVAAVVRAGNDATNTLNAQDAAARQTNQRFYIGQNENLGQQQLAKQQYDKFDKYTENYNKAAALRGAANQSIQNGINGAASLAGGLYGAGASAAGKLTAGAVNGTSDLAPLSAPTWGQTLTPARQAVTNFQIPQPFGYTDPNQDYSFNPFIKI